MGSTPSPLPESEPEILWADGQGCESEGRRL